jgi:hypothetical protein
VPDDVAAGQLAERDVVDAVEDRLHLAQAALRAAGQVDLGDVAGDDDLELKPSRVRNIFICSIEVFCASSRMMNASLSVRPRM